MMNRVKICALLFSLLVLLLGCGNEMNSNELIERYETPSVNEILNEIDTVGKDNSEGIEKPSINIESEDVVNLQDATLESNSEEVILSNNVEELIISLENYGNKDIYEQLANAEDYQSEKSELIDGTWNKTLIHTGMDVELSINITNDKEFDYSFDVYHYAQNDVINGKAYWKTNEFAIGKIYDEYIVFLFNDNDITVLASSYSEKIGLMSGMAVDGLYVREKPEYTNSNIFEETYTAEDILALKELIPPDLYEEDFEWVTREGVVEVSEEGGVKTINAYIPTMPEYGYTVTIASEKDYEIVFYD